MEYELNESIALNCTFIPIHHCIRIVQRHQPTQYTSAQLSPKQSCITHWHSIQEAISSPSIYMRLQLHTQMQALVWNT